MLSIPRLRVDVPLSTLACDCVRDLRAAMGSPTREAPSCCMLCDHLLKQDADARYGKGRAGVCWVGKRSDPGSGCVDMARRFGKTDFMRGAALEGGDQQSRLPSRGRVAALDARPGWDKHCLVLYPCRNVPWLTCCPRETANLLPSWS